MYIIFIKNTFLEEVGLNASFVIWSRHNALIEENMAVCHHTNFNKLKIYYFELKIQNTGHPITDIIIDKIANLCITLLSLLDYSHIRAMEAGGVNPHILCS